MTIESHEVVVKILGTVPDYAECEIVRCRDCENYSGEVDEIYPKWCMEMNVKGIEPYGFCAWGKRKELD